MSLFLMGVMFYQIKRFILFKLKTIEYRLWVYRQNNAIEKAFQLEARQPSITAVSILTISLIAVSSVVVYNMRGNISRFSVVEANLTIPAVTKIPNIQRPTPPSIMQEETIPPSSTFKKGKGEDFGMNDFTIAIDKVRRELFVLSRSGKKFRVIDKFNVLLGKNGGDKEKTGDMKTPEGVYKIIAVKEDDELLPMYGPRAFVLNYPNDTDKKQGKTGAGIWIHGIGEEDREPVTKGCIAVDNTGLLKLSNYIKINTNIFIFPEGFMIPIDGEGVADILNEAFILELKNSMVASNISASKKEL